MTLKTAVRQGVAIIADAEGSLRRLEKRSLEEVLEDYILLLLASGLLAGLLSLLLAMGQGAYYHLVGGVTVDYLRLLNYSVSIAAGTFFFYLFAGTFLLGVAGLLLCRFIGLRFVETVKLLCAAMAPTLLFGWLSQRLAAAFLLWTLALIVIGVRVRKAKRVK